MSVELRRMPDAAVGPWRERQNAGYITERMDVGESEEVARTRAAESDAEYFPGGRPRDGQYVYQVIEDATVVGDLWIGPLSPARPRQWWVFAIEIDVAHRGRGLGRATMSLAEREARQRGTARLGLNVFGTNSIARRLYESLGYEPTAIQLAKDL